MRDGLISRRDAVDALANIIPSLTTPDANAEADRDILAYQEAIVDAVETIKGLPIIESRTKWIPGSERVPTEGVDVLVWLRDWRTGESEVTVTHRVDGNAWVGCGRYDESNVAWMPLPEPYEEENNG